MSSNGKLIVIEGTDGSGKETQAKILIERLTIEGVPTEYADFPQHNLPSGFFVDKYLRGEYGNLSDVGPYKASLFYALDRFDKSCEMRKWLSEGKVVVCNRYVTANKGHQAGKIKDPKELEKFLGWLDDLEYSMLGIPKEDATILLYLPSWLAQKKVDDKGARAYLAGAKRDIHENDANHLSDAEKAYLYVAKKEEWHVVQCSDDGKSMLSRETIHERVYDIVKKLI